MDLTDMLPLVRGEKRKTVRKTGQFLTDSSVLLCRVMPLWREVFIGELPGKVDDALFVACHQRSVWQEFPCHCVYYTAHLLQRIEISYVLATCELRQRAVAANGGEGYLRLERRTMGSVCAS